MARDEQAAENRRAEVVHGEMAAEGGCDGELRGVHHQQEQDLEEVRRVSASPRRAPESSPLAGDSRLADRRDDRWMATRCRKEASVTRRTYEIRVIGSFSPDARQAFADISVQEESAITVLSGEFDQRGLHALLDRVRALGLELCDVRQAPPSA
jgi:hypothetical protein